MMIDGKLYRVHDLIGIELFGARPHDAFTIDHIEKDLDNDGCLSNKPSNLNGWASKRQQVLHRCSLHRSDGRPVVCKFFKDDEVIEFESAAAAAVHLGVTKEYVCQICNKTIQRTGVSPARHKLATIEWATQPCLVKPLIQVDATGVKVCLEVESWMPLIAADWKPGGKYHCTLKGSNFKSGAQSASA
jgi:hypothetical protein